MNSSSAAAAAFLCLCFYCLLKVFLLKVFFSLFRVVTPLMCLCLTSSVSVCWFFFCDGNSPTNGTWYSDFRFLRSDPLEICTCTIHFFFNVSPCVWLLWRSISTPTSHLDSWTSLSESALCLMCWSSAPHWAFSIYGSWYLMLEFPTNPQTVYTLTVLKWWWWNKNSHIEKFTADICFSPLQVILGHFRSF